MDDRIRITTSCRVAHDAALPLVKHPGKNIHMKVEILVQAGAEPVNES
jgi:hypothetical protein